MTFLPLMVRNPYKVTIYFPGRKLKHEAEKNYPGEFPFSLTH